MIETLLWIYIVICLSLIFFQCGYILVMAIRMHIERRVIKRLTRVIIGQIELIAAQKPIRESHLNFVKNDLATTLPLYRYEKALARVWEAADAGELSLRDPDEITNVTVYIRHRAKKNDEFSKGRSKIFMRLRPKKELLVPLSPEIARGYFFEYIRQSSSDFVSLTSSYAKKDAIIHAFYVSMLRGYGYLRCCYTSELVSNLKDLLDAGDCACREGVLLAFYEIGSPTLVQEALLQIDASDAFLHPKIISDGLLSFRGDPLALQALLFDHLFEYSVGMQVNLLNYMRFSNGAHCDRILQILQSEQADREVHYACIRYFGKYYYEPAYDCIADFADGLHGDAPEYSIVALMALRRYPCERTQNILCKQIKSSNWFVRYNATESLESLGIEYQDLIDIFDGRDRFARDMLQYQFDQRYILDKEVEP